MGAGLLAALAILSSGCSAGGGVAESAHGAAAAGPAAPGAVADNAAGKAQAGAAAAPGGAPAATAPTADPRYIAYTAQLSLEAKDVTQTLDRVHTLATGAGGYVSKESLNAGGARSGSGTATATTDSTPASPDGAQVVLKVPSAAFEQTLHQLSDLGKVLSKSSQADDLTQQVVDVGSRLKSQQASVDRVRALMAQTTSLTEIVSLESELSRREADLESLQKQQQQLTASTSLSTISVSLNRGQVEPAPAAAPKKAGFWGSIGNALGGGWQVLYSVVRGLLMAAAAVAPFVLVLGPLGWLGLRWRRSHPAPGSGAAARSGRRTAPGEDSPAPDSEAPDRMAAVDG